MTLNLKKLNAKEYNQENIETKFKFGDSGHLRQNSQVRKDLVLKKISGVNDVQVIMIKLTNLDIGSVVMI